VRPGVGVKVTQPVVVDLPAPPRERGEAHGEQLRPAVRHAVTRWKDSLAATEGGDPDEWIASFLAGTNFVPAIEMHTPSLLDEVQGLADGAGISFEDAFAFQLVDEQWCWATRRRAEHEHCSTLGIAGPPVVIAQNLDLPVWWEGTQTVLRYPPFGDDPGAVLVTAAGFIVMNGMNAAGVAIGVNALPDVPSATEGLPVAFVIRQALSARTAREAVSFVRSVTHASGQNYVVGDADRVVGVEADADGTTAYDPSEGCVLHTNHAVERTSGASWKGVAGGALANSRARLEFLASRRDSVRNAADAIEVLNDETVPIRRVPTDVSPNSTFATSVYELGSGGPVAHVRGGTGELDFVTVSPMGAEVAR
jgi:isopenicillin-N N-acyltransferase-like protein